MPYRTRVREEQRHSWRLPLLYNTLGLGRDEHVDVLKGHIAASRLAKPEKLDLVVIEDLEHLEELMAHGIPMARLDDAAEPPASRQYVRIRRRWWYGVWGLVLFAPSVWMWPTRAGQAWGVVQKLL